MSCFTYYAMHDKLDICLMFILIYALHQVHYGQFITHMYGMISIFTIFFTFSRVFFQLSTTPGEKEGIDVWFVLLDSPTFGSYSVRNGFLQNGAGLAASKKQSKNQQQRLYPSHHSSSSSISVAYRNLAKLTSQGDVPLRLKVSKDREIVSFLSFFLPRPRPLNCTWHFAL